MDTISGDLDAQFSIHSAKGQHKYIAMSILTTWIFTTVLLAAVGSKRKIGGVASFFISLFLSPVIGAIVVFSSKPTE
jgi:hypothetical protein